MQRSKRKLALDKETIRSLGGKEMAHVAGGISGPRGCHSIDDRCPSPTGGVTCNSADNICPSGPGSVCVC
ncbi:MAG TPA: class I lanthipeptide [Kofleriaceae bacterium]